MILFLSRDHKEHLNLLFEQTPQVLIDFCKLAIEFLQNGPNQKLYNTAALKLGTQSEDVQNCVYGLVNLLLESCKHKLNDADFRDSILTAGFGEDQQLILSKFYRSKEKEIAEILCKLSLDDAHYHDLNWRFEVQVASRSLLRQITPLITMDLALRTRDAESDRGFTEKHTLLQTDPTNLVHIADELEKALAESHSRHSRRIQRAFNA